MTRRAKTLPERLSRRNSALWSELEVGSVRVRAFLCDRQAKSLPEMHEAIGWFDADSATILVGADLAEDVAASTLVHELLHAVIFAGGLHVRPDGEPATDDEEEAVVNPIAAALFDSLKRNGMLVIPPRPKLPPRLRQARPA